MENTLNQYSNDQWSCSYTHGAREYKEKLSTDRGYPMKIENNNIFATNITETPLSHLAITAKVVKEGVDRAARNNSIEY